MHRVLSSPTITPAVLRSPYCPYPILQGGAVGGDVDRPGHETRHLETYETRRLETLRQKARDISRWFGKSLEKVSRLFMKIFHWLCRADIYVRQR